MSHGECFELPLRLGQVMAQSWITRLSRQLSLYSHSLDFSLSSKSLGSRSLANSLYIMLLLSSPPFRLLTYRNNYILNQTRIKQSLYTHKHFLESNPKNGQANPCSNRKYKLDSKQSHVFEVLRSINHNSPTLLPTPIPSFVLGFPHHVFLQPLVHRQQKHGGFYIHRQLHFYKSILSSSSRKSYAFLSLLYSLHQADNC